MLHSLFITLLIGLAMCSDILLVRGKRRDELECVQLSPDLRLQHETTITKIAMDITQKRSFFDFKFKDGIFALNRENYISN
jgi:hypothetical protein